MKLFTKKDKRSKLEIGIDKLHDEILEMDEKDPTLEAKMNRLEKLYEIKSAVDKGKISKDTLVVVGGNLLGILLVLNFEKLGIVTSKAFGLVIKGRV